MTDLTRNPLRLAHTALKNIEDALNALTILKGCEEFDDTTIGVLIRFSEDELAHQAKEMKQIIHAMEEIR